MQNIKKYFMTLALLIMAVGGAWAQTAFKAVEFEVPADWKTDNTPLTAADLPGFNAVALDEAMTWTGAPADGKAMLVYAFDGNTINIVNYNNGNGGGATTSNTKQNVFALKSLFKFYYTTEITEWPLTSQDGKVWTLAKMPANNIELQVEYFAESNLFLSKEALANKANISVLNGSTAVTFDDAGKSTTTVTEGNTVTAKFTGKKVLGMTVAKAAGNTYLKWDADQKKLVATDIPTTANKVQNSDQNVEWAGTYVVEEDVTISGEIKLTGDVELIIKDGATLTVTKINGNSSYNLSIYGQTQMSGELNVTNSGSDAIFRLNTFAVHSCKVTATSPAGGGGGFYLITTLNVYGGSLDAEHTGEGNGYGILLKAGGSMNIYGGEVKAVGKGNAADYSYGIRSSNPSQVANVKVYGGKLWAECATNKAFCQINLTTEEGFDGEIKTSSNGSSWTDWTTSGTPETEYVKVE